MSVNQKKSASVGEAPDRQSDLLQKKEVGRESLDGAPLSSVSIIIPAFNEEKIIGSVVRGVVDVLDTISSPYEVLVVDDGSTDGTAQAASDAGATVIRHPYNIGNGAAVKTGIRNAQGKVLVMLDGDGQHAPEDIPRLLEKVGPYDLVVGARTRDSESQVHRDVANQIYNWLASYICGRKIEDLTSGFRTMKADIARGFVYLLPNTFSYPTTTTLATVRSGYSLAYVPITAGRRVGRSKIKLLRDGSRFLLIILKIATFFSPLKVFVPASILMFLTGFGYGLFKVLFLNLRYGPTSAMLMTVAVLVFLVGLVSEQVAQLRFDRSERTVNEAARSSPMYDTADGEAPLEEGVKPRNTRQTQSNAAAAQRTHDLGQQGTAGAQNRTKAKS